MSSPECFWVRELQLVAKFAGAKLVEDVVASLAWCLVHHTGLLEQVVVDASTDNGATAVEVHFHPFAESTGVVISQCLRVTERFQHGVCIQDLLLDIGR